MKKSTQMSKRMVSVFFAFILVIMTLPVAFAVEPISLGEANVSSWPTATGEIYFGQKVSEGITLTGGTVVYEGESVPGHFEFLDPDARPSLGVASLKFVPDDTQKYKGFEVEYAWDVMFTINKTTPVLVDENNPPVATAVEAGAKLSTSTLTGGQIYNPYYPEEQTALAGVWKWAKGSTVVNESGYYEARITVTNYNRITTQVYVRIAGEIPETTITEAPTVPADLKYDGVTTWGDIPLEGGKAELKVEGTAIEGTFSVTDFWKTRTVNVGSYEIDVVFTPADPEAALPYSLKIPVTVNKGQMKFVDESGNEIVPEITVEYGTTFGDIHYYLESYVAGDDAVSIGMVGIENANKTLCKDGTYTASLINRTDSNYERTELPFKIVIKRKTLTPKLTVAVGSDGLIIRDSSGNYSPKGTFTLEYTIDGVPQEPITGIKYETAFEFNYNKSGNYEYTIIYNEAEVDEYFIIDDFTTSNPIFLTWKFSATGMPAAETYKYGSAVSYTAPAIDETKSDKPYYVFSEWSEVKGIEMTDEQKSNPEVNFTMPDNDVELKASYKFSFKAFFEWIWAKVVQFFTFIFNAVRDLFSLAAA